MADNKNIFETEKETTDNAEAEELQKSGWTLVSIVVVGKDKEGFTLKKYTLKKEREA